MNNFNVYPFNESSWPVTGFEEKHRHEYFEIIWLKSGTGIHQIDMIDHSYNDSVLFFLAPGQVHKIIQHKKSQGYVLKFLPDVFKQEKDFTDYLFDTCLLDTERSCPKIAIPKHLNDLFDELFLRFIEEFNNRQPHSDIILSSYLKILTTQIRRIKDSSLSKETYINKPQYDLFREFKIAVERNYKTKHTVQDYAIYLNSQAILEAKRRLYHDSKSIKELGYELGFDDPAYFTRFFKKNVGTAPQHFKINRVEISNPAFA